MIWQRGGTFVVTNNIFSALTGGNWGNKPEIRCDVRSQQDNSGTAYSDFSDGRAWLSAGTGTYPRQHQCSVNWNSSVGTNSGYYVDPFYIWNNTGAGSTGGGARNLANGGSWGSNGTCFVANRDFFNGGTPRPSYTPYTYPHPLRVTTGQAY
jgi:hypothetical protein